MRALLPTELNVTGELQEISESRYLSCPKGDVKPCKRSIELGNSVMGFLREQIYGTQ